EARVLREIAPDGDEVLDATRQHQVAVSCHVVAAGLDGGDVDRTLDPELLDAFDDRDRRLAGLAAGAGHRHERRTPGPERGDGAQERRLALRRARREELEGDERAALVKQLLDLHAAGSTSTSPSSPAPSRAGTCDSRTPWPWPSGAPPCHRRVHGAGCAGARKTRGSPCRRARLLPSGAGRSRTGGGRGSGARRAGARSGTRPTRPATAAGATRSRR